MVWTRNADSMNGPSGDPPATMPGRTIHTERLDLVPWDASHGSTLANLARRAGGVLPLLSRNPLWDPEHPEVVSHEMLHHWETHGFGWRAITERAAGVIVGFAGVTYLGQNDLQLSPSDFELGCWVHPTHWRRGLAGEAAAAVIDEAFDSLGATSVMGCARADHRGSIDGAFGLGFAVEQRIDAPSGADVVVLRVTAEDWAATRLAASRH